MYEIFLTHSVAGKKFFSLRLPGCFHHAILNFYFYFFGSAAAVPVFLGVVGNERKNVGSLREKITVP